MTGLRIIPPQCPCHRVLRACSFDFARRSVVLSRCTAPTKSSPSSSQHVRPASARSSVTNQSHRPRSKPVRTSRLLTVGTGVSVRQCWRRSRNSTSSIDVVAKFPARGSRCTRRSGGQNAERNRKSAASGATGEFQQGRLVFGSPVHNIAQINGRAMVKTRNAALVWPATASPGNLDRRRHHLAPRPTVKSLFTIRAIFQVIARDEKAIFPARLPSYI